MDRMHCAFDGCHLGAILRRILNSFWIVMLATASGASGSTSMICEQAARAVSEKTGIPVNVLRAITRTETGRTEAGHLVPWPWTVNMEGKGHWFDTEDEAKLFVFKAFKGGARSFDIGCFQINYRWHGHAFRTIEDMFDPLLNTEYAAEFLAQLYKEFGNWSAAAGAFHSRTAEHATRYSARFDEILADLAVTTDMPVVQSHSAMANRQALLPHRTAQSSVLGSLMPAPAATPVFIVMQSRGSFK